LKGLLAPFCLSLKDIKFLFATCRKGLATACKTQKLKKNRRLKFAYNFFSVSFARNLFLVLLQ